MYLRNKLISNVFAWNFELYQIQRAISMPTTFRKNVSYRETLLNILRHCLLPAKPPAYCNTYVCDRARILVDSGSRGYKVLQSRVCWSLSRQLSPIDATFFLEYCKINLTIESQVLSQISFYLTFCSIDAS